MSVYYEIAFCLFTFHLSVILIASKYTVAGTNFIFLIPRDTLIKLKKNYFSGVAKILINNEASGKHYSYNLKQTINIKLLRFNH